MKKLLSLCLIIIGLFVFSGCGYEKKIYSNNIAMEKMQYQQSLINGELTNVDSLKAYYQFSEKMISENYEKKNMLISPLSIYLALAMTTNGANNATILEMEKVLGLNTSQLNEFCGSLYSRYNEQDNNKKYVSTSNSIWYNQKAIDLGEPKETFLKTNAKYYGADIYKSDFDKRTIKDINNWVNNKTEGMIEEIIDDLSSDSVMNLVNTVLFKAKWKNKSYKYRTYSFKDYQGNVKNAEFFDDETYEYFYSDKAKAFMQRFETGNSNFAFLGILPNTVVSIDEYVNNFNGNELYTLLNNVNKTSTVNTRIPKFSYDYSVYLNKSLKSMGMETAFSPTNADFSNMYDLKNQNIYISSVFHKTKIELTKEGVSAAAATVVDMAKSGQPINEVNLYLDRPFMYCIMDMDYKVPLFIGVVNYLN
jgi:serpin B